MRFSLQELVANVTNQAAQQVKIAAEASKLCESCQKSPARTDSSLCKACALKQERHETSEISAQGEGEKTASARLDLERFEKLASAVEYIATNLADLAKQADAVKAGPAAGPNTLETNMHTATTGVQSEARGQATKRNQPSMVTSANHKAQKTTAPTQMDNNTHDPPGGTAPYPEGGVMVQKSASVSTLIEAMQRKVAEDATNPAQISAKKVGLDGEYYATAAGEGVPALPSEAAGQASMVASNDAAINYTKGQAKAVPKKRLRELLTEPALSKSTDQVLHANLDNAAKAGVKISSAPQVKTAAAEARSVLQKIAESGCTCKPGEGPCRYCQLKKKVEARKEKQSQGGGLGGNPLVQPPQSQMSSMNGGGM